MTANKCWTIEWVTPSSKICVYASTSAAIKAIHNVLDDLHRSQCKLDWTAERLIAMDIGQSELLCEDGYTHLTVYVNACALYL